MKKLYLSKTEKKICGVCGGLGKYFDIDPTVVRAAWVVMTLLTGFLPGILAYLILAIIIPKAS